MSMWAQQSLCYRGNLTVPAFSPLQSRRKHGPRVDSWSVAIHDDKSTKSNANLQLQKLNSIRLKDVQDGFGIHHEILTLMWYGTPVGFLWSQTLADNCRLSVGRIIQSDTTAAIKQRALQVFSFACTAASAGLHEGDGEHPHKQSMSVQTRRRLLGFSGDEDLENEEIHAPKLVQLSPLLLIDTLAKEFHLSIARDEKSKENNDAMWMATVQEQVYIGQTSLMRCGLHLSQSSSHAKCVMLWQVVDPKTANKKEKKQKMITVDTAVVNVAKVFDEVVFLMKRVVDMVNDKPDVVDLFDDHSQQVDQVRSWIIELMTQLPALLTEQGAALRGAGISKDMTEGLRTQTEIDVMVQVMSLDEMDLDRPLDESDEKAYQLIRCVSLRIRCHRWETQIKYFKPTFSKNFSNFGIFETFLVMLSAAAALLTGLLVRCAARSARFKLAS